MMITPRFTSDLRGGNGEQVDWEESAARLSVRPEIKDGSPYRGWFYFRLDQLDPGRTYTLRIVENDFAGLAVFSASLDGPWQQFASFRKVSRTAYTYEFRPSGERLYVAMMEPYRLAHLQRLIGEFQDASGFTPREAWTSEEGRPGLVLRIGPSDARPGLHRIWITARMHGFEAVSSWTAEGFVRWAMSAEPDAQWLRDHVELFVAPLVDVDSVERGATGKHRAPICFARDAGPAPHWAAIRNLVQTWEAQGPPDVFLDLHGPGGDVEDIYFYTPQTNCTTPTYEVDLKRLTGLLAKTRTSCIPYRHRQYRCPPGPDDRGQAMSGTSYLYLHQRYFGRSRLKLAVASETPWGHPGYDREAFLQAGADYGLAIVRFLRGYQAGQGAVAGKGE